MDCWELWSGPGASFDSGGFGITAEIVAALEPAIFMVSTSRVVQDEPDAEGMKTAAAFLVKRR